MVVALPTLVERLASAAQQCGERRMGSESAVKLPAKETFAP